MMTLSDEQEKLLILIGKPDDGSEHHFVADGERITQELLKLGLVQYTGKMPLGAESYDLTDAGERLYEQLTGDDRS